MNRTSTSTGQLIAAAGGVLLFVFLFLPWFGENGLDLSGWEGQSSTDVYMFITAIVAVLGAIAGGAVLAPGLTLNGAVVLLGAVATMLLIWLGLFDGEDRAYGMYLSLMAAIVITIGGLMAAGVGAAAPPRGTPPPAEL